MIGYYAAPRQRTAWTRAFDIAMAASFLVALPLTWVCDVMVVRPTIAISHSGQLFRNPNGSTSAVVLTLERTRAADSSATVLGMFQIQVEDRFHGWPLTTTVRRQAAQLDLDLRGEVRARSDVNLAMDDPMRMAIADALAHEGQHELVAAWPNSNDSMNRDGSASQRRLWLAWCIGAGLWWLILMFASFVLIQSLKLMSMLVLVRTLSRRAQLQAEGKCMTCGYDMTGLEFNERCPECGQIVW